MKRLILSACCLLFVKLAAAQELFAFTEPASNMPAKSIGVRLMNMWGNGNSNTTSYHLMPEVMVGVNNKMMFHLQGFFSNVSNSFAGEGGALYAKYRFISNDDVHSHFRMAAFGRASYNNALLHQEEIETMGHNSGFEGGLIATQLQNKTAISSSISWEHAVFNNVHHEPVTQPNNAINYTLSVGRLILPKEYINYQQTNLNIILEVLGQKLAGSSKSFLDIAPSVQLIFNSVARLDIGYRAELYSTMERTATNSFVMKFEYNFFNALSKL